MGEIARIDALNVAGQLAPELRNGRRGRTIYRTNADGDVVGTIDGNELTRRLLIQQGVDLQPAPDSTHAQCQCGAWYALPKRRGPKPKACLACRKGRCEVCGGLASNRKPGARLRCASHKRGLKCVTCGSEEATRSGVDGKPHCAQHFPAARRGPAARRERQPCTVCDRPAKLAPNPRSRPYCAEHNGRAARSKPAAQCAECGRTLSRKASTPGAIARRGGRPALCRKCHSKAMNATRWQK